MLHRRDFLAAAAAVVAASSLNAANTVRAFGVQLYTVAEAANRDLEGTLRRIAQIGYREIELGSLYGREPDAIRSLAEHFALRIPSVHVSAGAIGATGPLSLEGDLPRLAATVRAFGATHAVLSLAPLDELPRPRPGETFQAAISRLANAGGVAGWQRLAETLDTRGAALRREGVTLGYHNHNLEFLPLGDTCGWETLVAESDPGHLDFELDVGWVAAAGRIRWRYRQPGVDSDLPAADLRAGVIGLVGTDQAAREIPVEFTQLVAIDGRFTGARILSRLRPTQKRVKQNGGNSRRQDGHENPEQHIGPIT